VVAVVATPDGKGYWEVAADGTVYPFGDAADHGSMGGRPLAAPVVGLAPTSDNHGYWEVAADGGVFAYGDARFFGAPTGHPLSAPVVGMAATADAKGYWLVAADGGVFAYGDARFFGSMGGRPLSAPVVGMAATADAEGYWLVAADGGVFAYGDARFFGSMGGRPLSAPVVGMAATADAEGYWLVAADGGVFAYGDARFFGSMGGRSLVAPVVGMAPAAAGGGYWEAGSDGGLFTFGRAAYDGSVRSLPPPGPPRIALFGDSLSSEAGPDFVYLADAAGASVRYEVFGGEAICDDLATMASEAEQWQPTAAVIEFSGDNFTPCMAGYATGTARYYAKYRRDAESAIALFRYVGTRVILVGVPLDTSAVFSANSTQLNDIYASLASPANGVIYDDAGQAVMAHGAFTWTLPCLSFEPCTGPSGTNVVRSPDGIHFCPNGQTTLTGDFEICDVYSSGALRFAMAMLGPALGGSVPGDRGPPGATAEPRSVGQESR
jgi:hypothetical protein